MGIREAWSVEYKTLSDGEYHTATFDELTGAQLFWDTVVYCRKDYQVISPRPRQGDEMTNLMNMLLDRSEEGAVYDCTGNDIQRFIANRMDNGEFSEFERIEFVEVLDEEVDGWVEQFKLYLQQK